MSIVDEIQKIRLEFKSDLKSLSSENGELDNIRSKYIGRKGLVAELFNQMGSLSKEERPQFGKELNKLKVEGQSTRQLAQHIDQYLSQYKSAFR